MHYNFKTEIERIGSSFVAHVEVSGAGRAGNRRVTGVSIDDILEKVKGAHNELFGGVEAYHAASAGAEPVAQTPEEIKARKAAERKAKREAAAAAKKAAKAKGAPAKAKPAKKTKKVKKAKAAKPATKAAAALKVRNFAADV